MKILLSNLILPLPLLWLIILIGALFFLLKKKKTGSILFIIAIAEFFLFSFPWIPDFLAGNLENNFSPITKVELQNFEQDSLPVWVLGGGHDNDNRLSATSQLSYRSLGRLTEALRIMEATNSKNLLVSGGNRTVQKTQAEILRDAAISLGFKKENITIVSEPVNTWEEALHAASLLSSEQPFFLVTDAIHMTRAIRFFQQQDLKPIAAPCNFLVKKTETKSPLWWFPSSKNLEKAENAIHEYVGLFWYRLRGK